MSYDASNKRHIDIKARASDALETSHDEFINQIMGMGHGRAYIYDLLIYCNVFAQPFSTNPLLTAFGCGQLDVAQLILRRIHELCPDNYVLMMREANARDRTIDARLSRSNKDSNGRDSEPAPYVHPSAGDDSPSTADAEYNPVEREAGDE